MNIISDKPIKLFYTLPDSTNLEIDYIIKGRSILTNRDYTKINFEIKSIEYIVNPEEIKYFKRTECNVSEVLKEIPNTNSIAEYFTLARALKVPVQDIISKNTLVLVSAYRKKLLTFLRSSYCRNHFSSEMEKNILSIEDFSVLFQYFPLDTFFRDNNLSKKYTYIHNIRVKLYYILYPDQQKFVELFDLEFKWITECLNTFKITGLTFAKFSLENESILKPMRDIWCALIQETYQKAKHLLMEEKECAVKFEDKDAIKEIELINKELDDALNNINLDKFKTPLELLKFWPDILAPGPSLLYPHH